MLQQSVASHRHPCSQSTSRSDHQRKPYSFATKTLEFLRFAACYGFRPLCYYYCHYQSLITFATRRLELASLF